MSQLPSRIFGLRGVLLSWGRVLTKKHATCNVLGHKDLTHGHFSSIFLYVLQSPVINFTELRSLLLQLNFKKGMFACEIERIIGRYGLVDWLFKRVIVSEF
jgi:hypothetical protein